MIVLFDRYRETDADMKNKIMGRCACGAISYECSGEPEFSLLCQCRQCQRITGSGHAAQFAVSMASTQIFGEVKKFELTSDSGNKVESAFCETCGNPVYKTTTLAENLIMFHAATLDDPSLFKPQMIVHSESGQAWDHIDSDILLKP